MVEAADDMLEGRCCSVCGEWFHDDEDEGFPRTCAGCERAQKETKKLKGKKVKVIFEVDGIERACLTLRKKEAKAFLSGDDLTIHVSGYDDGLLPKACVHTDPLLWP